ncbi:PHP domain-containing protein [Candidatus Dependentiae bacterium]|nr:PHP domain-containing protein [Candidatus Dependentiae bacterium]
MKTADAVKKAFKDNQPAIAVTDHNLVSLHIKFYNECIKYKVKPIFGCECYFVDDADSNLILNDKNKEHIIIIAKNSTGLANLYKLVSHSRIKYPLKEKTSLVDWKLLELYKSGLIVTNACIYGVVANQIMKNGNYNSRAEKFLKLFGDDFYFEIGYHYFPDQRYANLKIIELAEQFGRIPIIVNDCHHLSKEDWYIQSMIFRKSFNIKDNSFASETQDSYLKNEKEMIELGYDRKFLTETVLLADKVELINPVKTLTEYSSDSSIIKHESETKLGNYCLASDLSRISPKESIKISSEYFGIDENEILEISSKIDQHASLAENFESNLELRNYLENNPMVKEAAFKLEGIVTDIIPDFDKVIVNNTGILPLTTCHKMMAMSQLCSEDLNGIAEIKKTAEVEKIKIFVDKLSIFSCALKNYDNDDNNNAVKKFSELENDTEFGDTVKYYTANAYYFNNNFKKAGDYYKNIINKNFDDEKKYWMLNYYGWINYKYYKDVYEAENLLKKAISICNTKPNAYYLLGIIYFDNKDFEAAKENFLIFIKNAKKKDKTKVKKSKEFIEKINIAVSRNNSIQNS